MKNLTWRGAPLIIIGAILALSAAFIFYTAGSRAQQAPVAPLITDALTKSEVLVAAQDVAPYTVVAPAMLKKDLVDKDKVEADDALEESQVIGKMTSAPLKAGQRVSLSQLTTASFSYTVPQGKRGMALPVDDLSTLSGLIEDGDYVDVLYSGSAEVANPQDGQTGSDAGGKQTRYTKTVLQDVQLLKVVRAAQPSKAGQPTQAQQGQPQANAPAGMVIVAVTDQQAEVMKFTRETGSLHLVLRAKDDHATEETTGANNNVLKDTYGVPIP